MFESYGEGKNIFAYGAAGTGKTFVAVPVLSRDVLDEDSPYDKVYIVRSLVATREIGFYQEPMKIKLSVSNSLQEHGEIHVRDA